jgi:isoquinoline 1-oxidoreductase alpha subunit
MTLARGRTLTSRPAAAWPAGRAWMALLGRQDCHGEPRPGNLGAMGEYRLSINGKQQTVQAEADMPLLWVLRDLLGLTGTKYGCGIAQCRACTVHLEGAPIFSCQVPVATAAGKEITTIEGLPPERLQPLEQAWVEEDVPQCGYCQPGQIMSAAALLAGNPKPTDADIDAAMSGNLCRCGTYNRIRRAIHRAAGNLSK